MKKSISTIAILLATLMSLSAQWEVKNVDEQYGTLFEIKFFDDSNGLAIGRDGAVLKSTDEGENWERIENNIIGDITDFDYITLDTLLAVSNHYESGASSIERRIYKSIDGGENWEAKHYGLGDFSCIQFISNERCIASGTGQILRSNDGGESWETVYDLLLNGFDYGEMSKFDMVNDSIGYATGLGFESSTLHSFLLKTTDSGESWEAINELGQWLKEMDFLNEDIGYVSDDEFTFKTIDGGVSWDTLNNLNQVADYSTPSLDKIVTVNRPEIYTAVQQPTVFAINISQDEGETWDGEYSDGAHMESVFFQTDSIGFVAGDYSIIMKTTNCGGEITGDYPWHLFLTSNTELKDTQLSFYPNPTTDKLFLPKLDSTTGWTYSIETLNGISIKKGELNRPEIDVSEIPQGLYVLIIRKGNQRKVGKFMKL